MKILHAMLGGAVLLSGCATGYQDATGSTATLTVRPATEDGTSYFQVYKDRGCAPNPGGANFYTTMGTFGPPTKKIPAGQEFVLTGTWSKVGAGMGYRCSETAVFVPQEGKTYVATISASMATNRCALSIEEQVAGGTRPVASYRKNPDLCFGEANRGARVNGVFDNIRGGATTITR